AHQKGYQLASVVGSNSFFVDNIFFPQLQITEPTANEAYTETKYYTRVFQLYDGTLVFNGYKTLLWNNKVLDEKKLQVLPQRRRRYAAGISSYPLVRNLKYWARQVPVYSLVQ